MQAPAALVLGIFLFVTAASSENDVDQSAGILRDDFNFEQKLDNFKDESAVREFRKHLVRGLLRRDEQFNMRDPKIRAETIAIIQLLFNATNDQIYVDLIWWLLEKMNFEQFAYVTIILLINRPVPGISVGDLLPTWYVTHPNYFVPDRILRKIKADVDEGTYNSTDVPLIVPDVSDTTAYFRDDPDLNSMYHTWNIYFPTWMDPKKYGLYDWPTRGELFYDFHHQLSTAYYLRSGTRKSKWHSQWEEPIMEGYVTELVNTAGQPFSSRAENHQKEENYNYQKLKAISVKIRAIVENEIIYVNQSYSIPLNGSAESIMTSLLSNIVYNTVDSVSPSYYGSFYETAVSYLASLGSDPNKDCGGLAGHPMTALRDPAFFQLLDYVNTVVDYYKKMMSFEYEGEAVSDDDLTLISMEVDPLETFFEPVDIDLRVWLNRITEPSGKYVVQQLRLNYDPFAMRFNISNMGDNQKAALISVFLTKDFFRSDIDEEIFQPIDSFKVIVDPGINVIERNISESKIFADGKPMMIPCGIPKTLLLPKGTEEGLKMNMFAVITPYVGSDGSAEEPKTSGFVKSPLCGNLRLNHGRSFGFPMDRPLSEVLSFQMIAYYNVSIYHRRNSFQGDITI